ncbi:MAG: hypothetical protein ACLFVS_02895 [Candidatus Acetothermia bacterium]
MDGCISSPERLLTATSLPGQTRPEGIDCRPLSLLTRFVDEIVKYRNDPLAEGGYEVKVTTEDGYSRTFNSRRVHRNDDMILVSGDKRGKY